MEFSASLPGSTCQFPPLKALQATGDIRKLKTIFSTDIVVGRSSQGIRVVISGRMADVCAELDRLIQLETQPFLH